jgi:hypothetical protein
MALQNRVTPDGDIIAVAARGTMMGNRGGCLHTELRTLTARRWASKSWICCQIQFKGRRRSIMSPGQYTELFFLDEATALAAGHRPCFECRRADANRFAEIWLHAHGGTLRSGRASAQDMDDVLHDLRIGPQRPIVTDVDVLLELPDGVMVRIAREPRPLLVLGEQLLPWTPSGYGAPLSHRRGKLRAAMQILTPFPTIAVMSRGYRPNLHPSAGSG